MGVVRGFLLEFREQLLLALGELLRRLDADLHMQIAVIAPAQYRHAFALGLELASGLRALGNFELHLGAVERMDLDLAAKRRAHHRNRHAAVKVGAMKRANGLAVGGRSEG